MILLTVAIAVATFASALSLRSAIQKTAIASYQALSGSSEWEISAEYSYDAYYLTADGAEYQKLQQAVSPYGELRKGYLFYAALGKEGGEPRFATVYSADYQELSLYNPVHYASGRAPIEQTEVVLSRAFAQKIGVKTGDYLVASRYGSDRESTLRVAGIAKDEGIFSQVNVLFSEVVASRLLFQRDEVRAYNKFFADISEEKIKASGMDKESALQAIRTALPTYKVQSPVKDKNVEITLNYQSILLFVIALIVAALGAVLIYTAVTLVVKNRIATAALFKSVGATSGVLSLYLLAEVLLYGLVGSLLGIAGSFGVSAIFGALTGSVADFSLGAGTVFAGIGFGLGLSLLSGLLPVLRLSCASLYDTLHAHSPVLTVKKMPALLTGAVFVALFLATAFASVSAAFTVGVFASLSLLAFLFAFMPLAIKGVSILLCRLTKDHPRLGKVYLAASGAKCERHTQSGARLLAIAVAAVVSVAVLLGEANTQLSSFERLFRADIMISASADELAAIANDVKNEEGVSGAYLCYIESRCPITGEQGNTVSLIAARSQDFEQAFRAAEYGVDVNAIRGERKIAMGGGLAMKLGLQIGDSVEITLDGKPVLFTLACMMDSPLTVVFTDLSGLGAEIGANTCLVNGGAEVYSRLSQKYSLTGAVYYAEDAFSYVTKLASSYIKVFTLFEFLVLLFAAAGYLNTALAAHRDRKREYALLSASGASKRDLLKIIVAENGIVVLSAFALGALFAVGLLFIVQNMLKSLGLYFTLLG